MEGTVSAPELDISAECLASAAPEIIPVSELFIGLEEPDIPGPKPYCEGEGTVVHGRSQRYDIHP
jgi:hypothetical protein